jgi:hypothetical protein
MLQWFVGRRWFAAKTGETFAGPCHLDPTMIGFSLGKTKRICVCRAAGKGLGGRMAGCDAWIRMR